MVLEQSLNYVRVNAKATDAFDIFNFRHYIGPNPNLNTAAYVFDFALTGNTQPLAIADYLEVIGDRYPHLKEHSYSSLAQIFAATVAELSTLEMDLHLNRWSVGPCPKACDRIAVQTLHAKTSRGIVYAAWDWFEAITRGQSFALDGQIRTLQEQFRRSVYGGPTAYALLRAADSYGIPAFYLWDEGLMQYGYGKNQVRGIATTFDPDSHLDSDFTTRKDDCKAFLDTLGFPVPQGDIVYSFEEALRVVDRIGFPVAVKPVVGHKGIGVTADVQTEKDLQHAFDRAVQAVPPDQPSSIIIEQSISGKDYRLLCVNGRFVAATERRPACVTGDGKSTIDELIDRENRSAARSDTPTSPMGQVQRDDAMHLYLEEQGLSLDTVLDPDETVYLRKVANLSAGGISIDATRAIHPDNLILAQDVAQHFRLTCLGIDVITADLGRSWKDGNFSILEINSAPGIFMHLKPSVGEPVDVAAAILKTFFATGEEGRIPTISFNRISLKNLQELIDSILLQHPDWVIGAVCQGNVLINRATKTFRADYNTNVQNLLRHPKLDLLIVEYPESVLEREGMFYYGSNLVVLDDPTEVEKMLARDVFEHSTVVTREYRTVSIHRNGLVEQYQLNEDEPFDRVYLKELATVFPAF
jgi:cyanophycin synthetase